VSDDDTGLLISYPARKKYLILDKQIWQIQINLELQGGNKHYAHETIKILKEITRERDM
jgi:hypothetical protein